MCDKFGTAVCYDMRWPLEYNKSDGKDVLESFFTINYNKNHGLITNNNIKSLDVILF